MSKLLERRPGTTEIHRPETPPPPQQDRLTQVIKNPEREIINTVKDIREGRLPV